jgi:hypothetical protein
MFMDGMSPDTISIELPTQGSEAAERRARHLRMLAELADIGMELVQHVKRQVLEEEVSPGRTKYADPVLAFTRLARAVRQTLALEAKVAAGGFSGPSPISQGAAESEGAWRIWDGKKKAKVRLKVEEAIASLADPSDAEDLLRDLNERLDDPEYGDEMSVRPVGMAFALICGALGLEVDLKKYSDAELGFDTEAMRLAGPNGLNVPAGAPAVGWIRGLEPPIWPPSVKTGSDPP